jgi:hypothetical protein
MFNFLTSQHPLEVPSHASATITPLISELQIIVGALLRPTEKNAHKRCADFAERGF